MTLNVTATIVFVALFLFVTWIGFIAAMLVFAGGMFGSIILFTRQRA